jgi:high-affinity nickel-transport protein
VPVLELVASSSLGSLLGMRHALEPDHLAAVSTLVSRERSGYKAALLGAWWGVGHTAALLAVSAVLIGIRAELPPQVTVFFELGVALMLIGLGVRACALAAIARDEDDGRQWWRVHAHSGLPVHMHVGHWTFARRPLIIGMVHGLAGSGALTALVLTTLPSTAARVAYIVLFGIGSTAGMATLSGVLGYPLARLGAHPRAARLVSVTAGAVSILLGLSWGYPLIADGLFTAL